MTEPVWPAVHYEGLQDRLAQARDARAALDALREEHRERLRRQAEETQRQRQLQMMQKLEIMRKKKQEYLQVGGRADRPGLVWWPAGSGLVSGGVWSGVGLGLVWGPAGSGLVSGGVWSGVGPGLVSCREG